MGIYRRVLHYNVERKQVLQELRKEFKRQLKANGINGNLGRVAEEWRLKHGC